jgi:hypothetical protein
MVESCVWMGSEVDLRIDRGARRPRDDTNHADSHSSSAEVALSVIRATAVARTIWWAMGSLPCHAMPSHAGTATAVPVDK